MKLISQNCSRKIELEQNPRDLEQEVYEEMCVGCCDEKLCHEDCTYCVQFYERLEELEESICQEQE